jgi:hypothetical protein
MTTWQIPAHRQSQELADALSRAISIGDLDAQRPLQELRVAASVDNNNTVAALAWGVRGCVADALRRTAAERRAAQPEGTPDPIAHQLEDMADAMHESVRAAALNGVR